MNFKKSWKRANEGFTLVELIVVIAILAILAGVAVPAYSGYIKKANKAADYQVLAAVNTAFAAAAMDADNHSISEDPDGSYAFNASTMTPSKYQAEFAQYFAGNTGVSFKTITGSLPFVNGAFVDNEGGSGTLTKEQLQAAVDRFNGSNYADNVEDLYVTVGTLSSALAGEMGRLDLANWLGDDYDSFMTDYKLTDKSSDTEKANALIMYTAAATEGVTAKDIMNMAGSDLSNLDKVTETYGPIPTAAMVYGVLTGYANSENVNPSFATEYDKGVTGVGDVYTLLNMVQTDPNFGAYLKDTEGKGLTADLDGYLAAMEVVNGHSGSFDLTQSDAFTNDETMALLNSLLGK